MILFSKSNVEHTTITHFYPITDKKYMVNRDVTHMSWEPCARPVTMVTLVSCSGPGEVLDRVKVWQFLVTSVNLFFIACLMTSMRAKFRTAQGTENQKGVQEEWWMATLRAEGVLLVGATNWSRFSQTVDWQRPHESLPPPITPIQDFLCFPESVTFLSDCNWILCCFV